MNRRAHRRGHGRSRTATAAATWLALLCLTAFHGCAGGSGSSGFDALENAAIEQAIDEQHCVDNGGLVICPADSTSGIGPTPRPTATASPVSTTAGPVNETPPVDTPATRTAVSATATAGAPDQTPTPTHTHTAGPTATSAPAGMHVDIGVDRTSALFCMVADDSCTFSFMFTAVGFPPSTSFLVAVRPAAPDGIWQISIPVAVGGPPDALTFEALIAVPLDDPSQAIAVQLAVLAQSAPASDAPASVDFLGESAAEFAFVTPELELQPIP